MDEHDDKPPRRVNRGSARGKPAVNRGHDERGRDKARPDDRSGKKAKHDARTGRGNDEQRASEERRKPQLGERSRDPVAPAPRAPKQPARSEAGDSRRQDRQQIQENVSHRPPSPRPAALRRTLAPPPEGPQRLTKLLARAGVASRRDAERLIAEGRIALHGVVVSQPAPLLATLQGVTLDGKPIARAEAARLFLLHKPAGVLTTDRDPGGRPTVYGLLPPELPRLMAVGRLDMTSEGLLLLTNDGALKRTLELPATGLERHYRVRAYGPATQQLLDQLAEGVTIEGVRYGPIRAFLESKRGDNAWIETILTEGKNREVRRVMEWLGLKVNRLIRTAYGPFTLGMLPPAQIEEVPSAIVGEFARSLAPKR